MSTSTPQPGWYPDPYGRFEFRYFNGERWTSDVATNGERHVDTPPAAPGKPGWQAAPAGARAPRGLAITAFILGLASLLLAWVPFIFALAAAGAICAIVFGVLALRSAREHRGGGRVLAITGLVLAPLALALCVVGFIFTRTVLREVDEYMQPGAYELIEDQPCAVDGSSVTFRGTIRNLDDSPREYTLSVEYLDQGRVEKKGTVRVSQVAPNQVASWSTSAFVPASELTCRVADVHGPFPFGLDQG